MSNSAAAATAPNQLGDVPPALWRLFQREQPYHSWNGKRNDPLWTLKVLNDSDKHHALHLAKAGFSRGQITVTAKDGQPIPGGVGFVYRRQPRGGFVHDTELLRFPNPGPEVKVKVDLVLQIQFGQSAGPAKDSPVIETLIKVNQRLRGILNNFTPVFEQP